jgi:hypothetical protein
MTTKQTRKTVAENFPASYVVYAVNAGPASDGLEFSVDTINGPNPAELFLDKRYGWTKSYVGLVSDDNAFIHAPANAPLIGFGLWLGYDKSTLPTDRAKGVIPAGSIPTFMIGSVGLA